MPSAMIASGGSGSVRIFLAMKGISRVPGTRVTAMFSWATFSSRRFFSVCSRSWSPRESLKRGRMMSILRPSPEMFSSVEDVVFMEEFF